MTDCPDIPMLDTHQAGHLRWWHVLARQPGGDWSRMGGPDPGQEWLDSYRYQIAIATYGTLLAFHYYLPAAPGYVADTVDAFIEKMLRRDVWGYWRETSRGGPLLDPDIESDNDLLPSENDPAVGNIMWSGHVALMAAWRDLALGNRYDTPGGIRIIDDSHFQGMRSVDAEVYEYSTSSLLDSISWQMQATMGLGVACEPNCIFPICNQIPLIAMRLHDLRWSVDQPGTARPPAAHPRAEHAVESFQWAWEQIGGMVDDETGLYPHWVRINQGDRKPAASVGTTAWNNSAMHAWNPEFVRDVYPQQMHGRFKPGPDGEVSLWAQTRVPAVRAALRDGIEIPDDDVSYAWKDPSFGYVAMMLAEVGDRRLDGMLIHADRHMNPTWERGGLYYPRRDDSYDPDGTLVYMDVLTGNSALGYARICPENGLRGVWRHTPTRQRHPKITSINTGTVDLLAARWHPQTRTLQWTMRTPPSTAGPLPCDLTIAGAPARSWKLTRGHTTIATSDDQRNQEGITVIRHDDELRLRLPTTYDAATYSLHWH